MMSQVFMATTSFSLGILAFCAGLWLTIWCINCSNSKEVRASRIAGYFSVILAIGSLSITSYYLVNALYYPDMGPMMNQQHHTCALDNKGKMSDPKMQDANKANKNTKSG